MKRIKKTKSRIAKWLMNPRVVGGIVLVVVLVATLQKYALGAEQMNNLLIFRASVWHLLSSINLYALSTDHADLFKYSPTFALCMLPFALIPLLWSALAWNMLNSIVFIVGIYSVSHLLYRSDNEGDDDNRNRTIAALLWICAVELLTSVQNFQSNALMAGLALCTLSAMERGKMVLVALYLALSFHIKIYGAAPLVLMLFYPQKIRFTLAFLGFAAVLTAAPLFAVSSDNLLWQYQNWKVLLESDHAASYGLSAMSLLSPLLPNVQAVSFVQAFSLLVLCAPVLVIAVRPRLSTLPLRLLCGASVLMWMVIFNHKAESPTFIIALAGVSVWYALLLQREVESGHAEKSVFFIPRRGYKWLWNGLLWFVIVGTSLSVTDFFPESLRSGIFASIHLKVLPCIAIWLYIQVQLWHQIITSNFATGTQFER